MRIQVKKLKPEAKVPSYGHRGDAGGDLYSCIECTILPGEQAQINTGLVLLIPQGYVGLIWDKSGIATNHGMHVLAGLIDSTYRGEILVVIKNLGKDAFKVEKGMKIAQILIQQIPSITFTEVEALDTTLTRGNNGFGSTGLT